MKKNNTSDLKTEKIGKAIKGFADKLRTGRKNVLKLSEGKHVENTFRVSGAVLFWLIEYAARTLNTAFLDNFALRVTEKKFKNKEKSDFVKKNPALAAHLLYYMIPLLLIGGVKTGKFISEKIKDFKKEAKIKKRNEEIRKAKYGTYEGFLEQVKPITPLLIGDIILKEGLRLNEQGLHVVYDDKTGKAVKPGQELKGIATIGFGSTVLKDGETVNTYTKPITSEEAYELARTHIEEKETLFVLYCYDVAYPEVDLNIASELIAISSLGYNLHCVAIENENENCKNRFEELKQLRDDQGGNITDEQVVQAFEKYPVTSPTSFGKVWLSGGKKEILADKLGEFLLGGTGLRWRRWLEACILSGEISIEELIQIPVHGMPEFFKYVGSDRENWFMGKIGERKLNRETVKIFKEWIKNPVDKTGKNSISDWPRVSDYVPEMELNRALAYKDNLKINNSTGSYVWSQDLEEEIVDGFDGTAYVIQYEKAIENFKKKDFDGAAEIYKEMIKENPNDALVRNDLALTYIKMEKYNDAIKQANEVFEIGDKSQYAAANYNLGLAYEKKGKLKDALRYYRLSVALGNKKVQKDIDRLDGQDAKKKLSYNSGIQKIHQKNAKHDVFLYGKENRFNV